MPAIPDGRSESCKNLWSGRIGWHIESQQSDAMAANERGHEKRERLWTRTQVGEVEVCWDEDHDGKNSKTNYDKVRKKSNNTPKKIYRVLT